ncbi:hypothetical protein CEXT_574941 [Caerostris extrusa]|uniref:Sushi domain-containing protein n=1 Tax=Caerostris extrusa TaxID=172846 RepID=A0AAV4Y6N1_CAEEX|nr:hypothetical protein CEXT_574941 [Caerostris extrusa]
MASVIKRIVHRNYPESCKLGMCERRGKLLGMIKLFCLNFTKWTTLPKCKCPAPSLSEGLFTTHDCSIITIDKRLCPAPFPPVFADYTISGNCSGKLIGQLCLLKCIDKNFRHRRTYITCQRNFTWSSPRVCGGQRQDVRVKSGSMQGLGRLTACDKN